MLSNTSTTEDDVAEGFHQDMLKELFPVIICLSFLSLFGAIGNGFSIGFYGFHSRKTPTVLLITILSVIDLSVCIILIHAIIEIALNIYYTNRFTCKLFHILVHCAIASSALILSLISIDRYRRICHSLDKQIEMCLAKKLASVMISFAFLLSIRNWFNFDVIEFPIGPDGNTTSTGHYCTTTDDPLLQISVSVFSYIDALLIVSVIFILLVTYGRIVWKICKSGRTSTNEPYKKDDDSNKVCRKQNNTDVDEKKDENECTRNELTEKTCSNTACKTQGKHLFKTTLKKTERRITLLMLIVSAGFCICFVPYFIIKIGLRSIERTSDLELNVWTQLGIRLVYVNSILNPVLFCVFNPQFRKYLADTISKCRQSTTKETEFNSDVQMHTESTQVSM